MNIRLIIIQLVVMVLLHNLFFQFFFVLSLNNAEIIMFCIGQDAFLCLANKITPGVSYCHTNVYDCMYNLQLHSILRKGHMQLKCLECRGSVVKFYVSDGMSVMTNVTKYNKMIGLLYNV